VFDLKAAQNYMQEKIFWCKWDDDLKCVDENQKWFLTKKNTEGTSASISMIWKINQTLVSMVRTLFNAK